ncbi:hypothetical protein [Wenjunlia tyrosinilytica]|uniref:Uncharacterized protein n=1 Tax=Wenjunlia tyrosinilytica TaxID=1544741 RepID=A0A917ZQ20_9ACTN|nr:hypothetical protein [Wenjunlia tyrosinilytica]GGO88379.1 hypothetical protein GCM10012280_29050 [Wenjunlia tyrosinilytica]
MRAKTEAREQARELRRQGRTYDEIVEALGVAKSSVSLWVRDLPKPAPRAEHMAMMREARWGPYRRERDIHRQETKLAAAKEVGQLTDRELFLVGVGLYWAEGTKSKPHARREYIQFVNSDPDVLKLFLRWLELLGVEGGRRRFTVSIHESGQVAEAERYWADLAGVPIESLGKTVIKKHNPKTVRKNVGDSYRGCLAVYVSDSADLYRRIEGWWYGIVVASAQTAGSDVPS